MKEKKIGGLSVGTTATRSVNTWVIALFGYDTCGKSKLALTAPAPIGYAPLETKAFPTIRKDGDEAGVEVIRPTNEMELLMNPRKVSMTIGKTPAETDTLRQQLYIEHVRKVEEYIYGLAEEDEIRSIVIDKFTTYCNWVELSINGMQEKVIKIQGQYYKDKKESNQHIVDFINSLGHYGKPVILINSSKGDYDGPMDAEKKPVRNTWEGFKYLGSHCNAVVEVFTNPYWDPDKNGVKYDWHYGLHVKRSQTKPELEGPDGMMLLKDDSITLPRLMKKLDPDFDPEFWMPE